VRDLLREHHTISGEVLRLRDQVAVLTEQLRLLQELRKKPPPKPRKKR